MYKQMFKIIIDKNIIIQQELEEFSIYGFEQQLIQVIINILNNSRDAFEKMV